MSGFTRETLVNLEKRQRTSLQASQELRDAVIAFRDQMHQQRTEDQQVLERALAQVVSEAERLTAAVTHDHMQFVTMPWRARWRWLFTGQFSLRQV